MRRELIGKTAIALTLVGVIGLGAAQTAAQQVAPNDPLPPALRNGALAAPGARTDIDTVPSKFSARTAADDKLPIAAYTLKHLDDEQRRAIYQSLRDQRTPGFDAASAGSYSVVGGQIPTVVALNGLQTLPEEVVSRLPDLRGMVFARAGDKILLVNPNVRTVIAVLSP